MQFYEWELKGSSLFFHHVSPGKKEGDSSPSGKCSLCLLCVPVDVESTYGCWVPSCGDR